MIKNKTSIKRFFRIFVLLMVTVSLMSCRKDVDTEPQLTVSTTTVSFPEEGGTSEITISTNSSWSIANSASSWLELSQTTGNAGSFTVQLVTALNATGSTRSTILNVTSPNGQARKITVSQVSQIYPSYNMSPQPPDATGMSSNAVELAAKIKLGWNLGNTLEAMGGETNWGNPPVTAELIQLVKSKGFNAVRIPCSWDQYLSDAGKAEISETWLNRVKEVVQYCIDNDMYVLLNIHWDGGWLDENINLKGQDVTRAKQKAFWEQIATAMREFDERVMFASANEPPVDDEVQMQVLNSYHQAFIDAVRSTGGRNSYRVLVLQGPHTDIEKTDQLMNTLPVDKVDGKLMVEVHYYGPWLFAGLTQDVSWGDRFFYWGQGYHSTTDPERNATFGEEDYIGPLFNKMKTKFGDKGIPVVLGEYGAIRRTTDLSGDDLELHLASRAYYIKYVTQQAIAYGFLPFYWDEGSLMNHGFGFIDRRNYAVGDQQLLDAILAGAQ